ncbi:cystin-1 [Tenrec ecaudatus]|uniref:cystin-1 n=1 Tax=Tenrec ecaudatus TaxID=94439 RepID=UPI003F5AB7E3
MGSGSSRSGRALKRLRSPDSRPMGPGGAAPGSPVRAAAEAPEETAAWRGAGAEPPDGGDETLRLLDQLLAESETWDPGESAPRGSARPCPARCAGSLVALKHDPEDHPESGRHTETPSSSGKRPEGQPPIVYDYSEEELMASIEREYCR